MEGKSFVKVTYTFDINKKRFKKWLDGYATFSQVSENMNNFQIRLQEESGEIVGDFVYKSMNSEIPSENEEINVGKILICIGETIDDPNYLFTNKGEQSAPKKVIRKIGLSKRVNKRNVDIEDDIIMQMPKENRTINCSRQFKPPRSITPVIFQNKKSDESEDDKCYEISKKRQIETEKPVFEINKAYEEKSATSSHQLRDTPRTLDMIFDFFNVNNDQSKIEDISEKNDSLQLNNPENVLRDAFSETFETTLPNKHYISLTDTESDSIISQSLTQSLKDEKLETSQMNSTANELQDPSEYELIKLNWETQKIGTPPSVPETFSSIDQYRGSLIKAVVFELNYKIYNVYRIYKAALFSAYSKAPLCPKHKCRCVFRLNSRNWSYYYECPQCGFKQPVPPDVPLTFSENNVRIKDKAQISSFMNKKGYSYNNCTIIRTKESYYLNFISEKNENVEYSKDDLWVIYNDRLQPFFVISESYGVFSNSRIEIGNFFHNKLSELPQQIRVTAIRIENIQSERQSLNNLLNLNETNLPLCPMLLCGNKLTKALNQDPIPPEFDIKKLAQEMCDEYSLNEDQSEALFRVADFFDDEKSPTLLVHGVFGAGKSNLLSIMIIFLSKVLTQLGRSDKILIAAYTNVAVDNVLTKLLDFDFNDFTRVGSVKKIDRNLLRYVTGHGTEESINELNSMMKDVNQNIKIVQEALKDARAEMGHKTSKIDSRRVVGVTCAACSFPVMQNRTFKFVLLDECSQQTEPTSLIPMCFGCERLVCCGDPNQLPPTLAKEAKNGYGRPLFTRMSKISPPLMLSIQYRCNPMIADICSHNFYHGKVKNGVDLSMRSPLFGMPTMCVFNVKKGQEEFHHGSYCNTSEAITVYQLVKYLINLGITPEEIGVIAFYKAQVEKIANSLSEGRNSPLVTVSTVDAFQGEEREVIIISTTKTSKSSFIDSPNRVNVAISRAKRHLFFVMNIQAMLSLEKWLYVIQKAGDKPNFKVDLENPPDSFWQPFVQYPS